MKPNFSIYAFFTLSIFNLSLAIGQTTVQLNPINAVNATGYVNAANVNTSGDLVNIGKDKNSGYMTFDLSTLPNGATITAANLTFYVDPASTNIAVSNNSQNIGFIIGINKNTVISPVLFSDIQQGVVYADNVVWDGTPGSKSTTFLPAGITAIQTKIGTVLGIGIRPPVANESTYGKIGGYESEDILVGKPVLSITYTTQAAQRPTTDFFAQRTTVRIDSAVNFFDNSGNSPTSWVWDFGDGDTSHAKNPTHQYDTLGKYTVQLIATNSVGSDTLKKINYITIRRIPLEPVAGFTVDNKSPLVNTAVQFTDTTLNEVWGWEWDFGDDSTSNEQHPIHTYTSTGTYSVRLIASGEAGSDTILKQNYITVINEVLVPEARFGYTTNALQASFTDSSINGPTYWYWDFDSDMNPGTYTSNDENPTFTYGSAGTYSVCLTVENSAGTHSLCKDVTVEQASAPVAAFTHSAVGLTVNFYDNSSNNPTEWNWTFGDTQSSTEQNPVHTYANAGTYVVCLEAENIAGSDTKCQNINVVAIGIGSEKMMLLTYPNPANNIFYIQGDRLNAEKATVSMLNLLGENIAVPTRKSGNVIELNIEGLESGIYFIRVEDGNSTFNEKITVY